MQPSASPPRLEQLEYAWKEFTASAHLSAELDPLVAHSWQRCAPRLNPTSAPKWAYVSEDVLTLTLAQHDALCRIARPIMEDIQQFIEGASAQIILTDATNCALELIGDSRTNAALAALGLKQGAFLVEGHIGTNAVAVALIESSPAQIVGPEHFLTAFHEWSSVAAPFFDPEGHPLGAIGLFEPVTQRSAQSLGIVVAAAKAIENQLQADLFVREANAEATELNATMDAISEGVLAWTAQGLITHLNNHGGELLGLVPHVVVGRALAEYITLPEGLARAAARGEELTDVEISFGIEGAAREFLVSLRVIRQHEGTPAAYIVTLRRIEQVHQLVTRLVGAQARLTLDDIVGHGSAARRVRRQALAAANARGCVLLVGEPGTSKNPLARAIHNSGRRANGPFLAIHCRAIPRELVLGEFLGFEAGAFNSRPSTGQPSKFELADGGTLYLDEVEALPLEMQAALARVIESDEVIRLGGTRVIPVDVRVIASTETDLEARLAEDAFRNDLFFRLISFLIKLPALRERSEDIPLLIDRLVERLSLQFGRALAVTPAAKELLCAYPWPGNVTELESVMERAALHSEGKVIQPQHLPDAVRQRRAKVPSKSVTEPVRTLVQAEQAAILAAGRAAHGNLKQTAQFLGIGRTTLWRKMKELKISPEDFSERNRW